MRLYLTVLGVGAAINRNAKHGPAGPVCKPLLPTSLIISKAVPGIYAARSRPGRNPNQLAGLHSQKSQIWTTVEARKLNYHRSLSPKQKEEGTPAYITQKPYSNFWSLLCMDPLLRPQPDPAKPGAGNSGLPGLLSGYSSLLCWASWLSR